MLRIFMNLTDNVLYLPLNYDTSNSNNLKYQQLKEFLEKFHQRFLDRCICTINPDEYKGLQFSPTQKRLRNWVLETAEMLGLQVKIIDLPTIEEGNEEIQTAIEALRPFAGAQVVHDCISYLMSQNLRPVCYKAMCKFPTQKLYAVKMVMAEAQISLKAAKDAIDEIWNG